MKDKKKKGGARPGAGRPKGSGRFGKSATKVVRVPEDRLGEIMELLKFPKKVCLEPGSLSLEGIWSAKTGRAVPVTFYSATVSAGQPCPVDTIEEGHLDINDHLLSDPEETFFVRVSGDSMINAGIHPGDLLVVDRRRRPESGKVAVVVVNGELTVKRLFKDKSRLYLVPENTNYPTLEISEEMDIYIWGVVTNVIHSL
ncbi:MAG: translesion error-prone DNA polymerase V autoproteolytic subunit [bacterium]|nr:translesion error-prone DNA polymerase V autoproteolytic subunit [bacterium]